MRHNPAERRALEAWLFERSATYREQQFWLDLYDELDEMYGFYDALEPERWYARFSLAAPDYLG